MIKKEGKEGRRGWVGGEAATGNIQWEEWEPGRTGRGGQGHGRCGIVDKSRHGGIETLDLGTGNWDDGTTARTDEG